MNKCKHDFDLDFSPLKVENEIGLLNNVDKYDKFDYANCNGLS